MGMMFPQLLSESTMDYDLGGVCGNDMFVYCMSGTCSDVVCTVGANIAHDVILYCGSSLHSCTRTGSRVNGVFPPALEVYFGCVDDGHCLVVPEKGLHRLLSAIVCCYQYISSIVCSRAVMLKVATEMFSSSRTLRLCMCYMLFKFVLTFDYLRLPSPPLLWCACHVCACVRAATVRCYLRIQPHIQLCLPRSKRGWSVHRSDRSLCRSSSCL